MSVRDHCRLVRRAAGHTSASWRCKQILASLIAIGSLGSVTVAGTYALLNSEETNARSSIATGTLTFSDTVESKTACNSYAGPSSPGNVNKSCEALMSVSEKYPGAETVAKVKIANNGSLDAAGLSVYMPSCEAQNIPSPPPNVGNGNPCAAGGDELYIQETNSAGEATTCWFPEEGIKCSWVANSLQVFAENYKTITSVLSLGSGPAHGQTRYFVIGLRLPSAASNSLQGREAVFGLTWHLTT